MFDYSTHSLFHRGTRKHTHNTESAGAPPAPANSSGTDATLINRDALVLLKQTRPPRRPKVPTAPGPVIPQPGSLPAAKKIGARPQPLIDPDVDTAFTDAGIRPARGTLAERAALHLTRMLRDMMQGKSASSPSDVPFYVPIAAAYGAMQQDAVNAACQANVLAIRGALAQALAEHTDTKTAAAAAQLAVPFVSWDVNDNAWTVNLYSGAFVDALWDIVGGRSAQHGSTFDALMHQLQETARGPMGDTLEASEERYYDLVDRVMGIIMDTQMRLHRE